MTMMIDEFFDAGDGVACLGPVSTDLPRKPNFDSFSDSSQDNFVEKFLAL
jgi:hypothetical protein